MTPPIVTGQCAEVFNHIRNDGPRPGFFAEEAQP
jgi:hypothetical protein